MSLRTIAGICIVVAISACSFALPWSGPRISADTSPEMFVLTLDDLPERFEPSQDDTRMGPTTNEDIADKRQRREEVLMNLNEWGRVAGYEVLYETSGFDMLAGTAFVHSWASVFASDAGADAYFEAVDTPLMATSVERTLQPISLPPVGDRSKGTTYVQAVDVNDGQIAWKFYRVTFRKHNVVAGVITVSMEELANLDAAVELAKTMEARIE